MFDESMFKKELIEAFFEKHPKMKDEESILGKFAEIFAEIATLAIAKYDRESYR